MLILKEAFKYKCPIVTNDKQTDWNYMEDGKIDPLHPPFDLLEVAKAMAWIYRLSIDQWMHLGEDAAVDQVEYKALLWRRRSCQMVRLLQDLASGRTHGMESTIGIVGSG